MDNFPEKNSEKTALAHIEKSHNGLKSSLKNNFELLHFGCLFVYQMLPIYLFLETYFWKILSKALKA